MKGENAAKIPFIPAAVNPESFFFVSVLFIYLVMRHENLPRLPKTPADRV